MNNPNKLPLALIILDGWGVSTRTQGNALALAHTPYYDEICSRYPRTQLAAAGESVGLAANAPGSAEAGHLNLGAGRVVQTEISRISRSVRSGEFENNAVLGPAMARAAAAGKPVHLIGLLSDGGVHSSLENLYALLRMAKRAGVTDVFVHGILDGRDVPPRTADIYVEALEVKMADIGLGKIATLCGRFFAMDSGENWERTARAFTMLVHAEGERAYDARTVVQNSFLRGLADEFIAPIVLEREAGVPVAKILEGDTVIFFNHRADTMRQLARSLAVPDVHSTKPSLDVVCLTEYDSSFNLPVAFKAEAEGNALGEVLSNHRIANYRISGSDRFPHVTNFLNGGTDVTLYECDVHVELPSSSHRESEPEMESFKVTDQALKNLRSREPGVLVMNLSASAIAAETGNLEVTKEAVQYIDTCLGGIVESVREAGGVCLITASHGSCEEMLDEAGLPSRFNSANPVPFHIICDEPGLRLRDGGSLSDVAPTMLGMLGIPKPSEMTGEDLRVS